jgi:Ca-activated chloride channel family protein
MPTQSWTIPAVVLPGPIRFVWPAALAALLTLPVLAGVYIWLLRRAARSAVRVPQIDTLAAAMQGYQRGRRHVAAVIFLLAIAITIVAVARPLAPLPVPTNIAGVMIAVDVSGSMMSQDIVPNRLEAAKAAAKTFVTGLPRDIPVGLVTFARNAVLHSPPTDDHQRIVDSIDSISTRHRTAIGEGLVEAVAALPGRVRPLPDGTLPQLSPGSRPPGAVVLLSDGQNNSGIDPLAAADVARRQNVTVYTIGIGRRPGEYTQGWVIGGPVDDETLGEIARRTGGEYYHPSSADEMRLIYRKLARHIGWQTKPVEVTAVAALAGAAALVAAVILSLLRQPLI